MDAQKLSMLISKMVQPGSTIVSLTMCAEKLGRSSQADLEVFISALCRQNLYKAALVAHRLSDGIRAPAIQTVRQLLAERRQTDVFSHWDLLAITVFEDAQLLQDVSPFLHTERIRQAFSSADEATACKLLRMGLTCLSDKPCAGIREAFCTYLQTHNSPAMDKAFPELLPTVLAHNADDVLTAWIHIIGAEKAKALCGRSLALAIEPFLLSGNGSLPLWEIFLSEFFAVPHTARELQEQGLAKILAHADAGILNEVGAWFYLQVAAGYGVDQPVFDAVSAFSSPQAYSPQYRLRYKETFRALWNDPAALVRFLEKTALFNPFLVPSVQGRYYTLVKSRQDLPNYDRLRRLFETQTSVRSILIIFFHTDLRQKLPLEDLFSLAQHYGVLSELLELLQDVVFSAIVTKHRPHLLVISPFSYFVTELHTMPMSYRIIAHIGSPELTAKTIPYRIVDFQDDAIVVAFCPSPDAAAANEPLSWPDAVAELQALLCQTELPDSRLQQLSIVKFTSDPFQSEIDFNLLTQVLLDNPAGLPVFLRVLKLCKWNAMFLKADLKLPGRDYAQMKPYCLLAAELFRCLFASGQDPAAVLALYFSSIYKVILPLNQLLLLADRELLLTLLSEHTLYCRIREGYTNLCRFLNINCAPICAVSGQEAIAPNRSFAATVSNFTIQDGYVFRIYLQPVQNDANQDTTTDTLFRYIASNKHISHPKAHQFASLSGTADWSAETLLLNLRRMEKAILLRKSDGAALMELLRITGQANPFAFQANLRADKLYLHSRRLLARTDATAADFMILNAGDIQQVCALYLHTHIKFHLTIPQLIQLLQQRRPDLVKQIPSMFDDTVFYAIADNKGSVWMPWVKQASLRVAPHYAGQLLYCHLHLNPDGRIKVSVLDTATSDSLGELVEICLQAGYVPTPYMNALCHKFSSEDNADLPRHIDYNIAFADIVAQFERNLRSKLFRHDAFAEDLDSLIRKSRNITPDEDMISAIAGLVEQWIRLYPDEALFQNYLFSRHIVFSRYYQSVGLGLKFCQLADQYLDEKAATAFKKGVAKSVFQLTGRPMEPGMDPTIPRDPEEEAERPHAEALDLCKEALYDTAMDAKQYCNLICKLIRHHHKSVSARDMCMDITGLLEQWLPAHSNEPDLAQLLHGIHVSFVHKYPTEILDVALCRMYRRYADEQKAQRFEQQLAKSFCRLTNQPIPDQLVEPASNESLPYDAYLSLCRELLNDTQLPPNKFCKHISKIIRTYHETVSAEQMEADIVSLMEKWIPIHCSTADLPTLLYGLHDSFLRKQQSESLGQALYRLYRPYTDEKTANSFAKRLQKARQNLTEQE